MRGFQHQMVVVVHKDLGMTAHLVVLDHFGQGADEPLPVGIIADNGPAVIAACRHMVDGAGVAEAQRPSHGRSQAYSPKMTK